MLKLMWWSKMAGSNVYEELMYQLQDVRFLGGWKISLKSKNQVKNKIFSYTFLYVFTP